MTKGCFINFEDWKMLLLKLPSYFEFIALAPTSRKWPWRSFDTHGISWTSMNVHDVKMHQEIRGPSLTGVIVAHHLFKIVHSSHYVESILGNCWFFAIYQM